MANKLQKMNCPICRTELNNDLFGLFCPNEECYYITEIPNIVNEKGIIPLLYENDKLIKWIEVTHDVKEWYLNGIRHREDGPAIECGDDKHWYLNGIRHREDGPAIEWSNGNKYWYLNGQLHREDGPAIEYSDGNKYWYYDGRLHHREDGPAVEYSDGYKEWLANGKTGCKT